jgi:hypothetical protein
VSENLAKTAFAMSSGVVESMIRRMLRLYPSCATCVGGVMAMMAILKGSPALSRSKKKNKTNNKLKRKSCGFRNEANVTWIEC